MPKLFDGIDQESYDKLKKIITDGRRDNKKQKHKKKEKVSSNQNRQSW